MLAHAQELVYTVKELMPTQYQKDNLEAMLGLFVTSARASVTSTLSNKIPKCVKSIFKYQSLVNKGDDSYSS